MKRRQFDDKYEGTVITGISGNYFVNTKEIYRTGGLIVSILESPFCVSISLSLCFC